MNEGNLLLKPIRNTRNNTVVICPMRVKCGTSVRCNSAKECRCEIIFQAKRKIW